MTRAATAVSSSAFHFARAADGTVRMNARRELGPYARSAVDDLRIWAERTPEAVFVAERSERRWRELTYGDAFARVRALGGGLLDSGASPDAPLAIIAENGIEHALASLAGMYVGIPVAPISVGYAGPDAAPERLRDLLAKLGPAFVFANDPRIAARAGSLARTVTSLGEFEGDAARADAAAARVGPETVAKIMFTSGSTGTPKGVITTHRMLCANQTMLAAVWPELGRERPRIVDWLPWSHCFGGSHNFGLILHNGGSLYVDGGRPVPGLFERTLENLRALRPTIVFSVPRGFALLLEHLKADAEFASILFSRLRILCSGGAALPDPLREALFGFAERYSQFGVRITSSWGTTECAPFATTSWGEPEPDIDTIGTPAPGLLLKLAPAEDRFEIRVKGPNITPGYWRDPEATRAAFDDEGYYRTGDAGELKDPTDPARGILFAGRLVENFKLTSGTWVNVGALRLTLLERGAPLIEDLIVSGHDRDEIALLVFISRAHVAKFVQLPDADHATLAEHPALRSFLANVLAEHNAKSPGTSTRVARALILPEPPNRGNGEMTDKGSVNQRRALHLRAPAVAALYAEPPGAAVVLPATVTEIERT
jgi:feruloyl-CoA synthase